MEKHWLEHVENSRNKIAIASGNLQEIVSFTELTPMTHVELLHLIDVCDNVVTHLNALIVKERTIGKR